MGERRRGKDKVAHHSTWGEHGLFSGWPTFNGSSSTCFLILISRRRRVYSSSTSAPCAASPLQCLHPCHPTLGRIMSPSTCTLVPIPRQLCAVHQLAGNRRLLGMYKRWRSLGGRLLRYLLR